MVIVSNVREATDKSSTALNNSNQEDLTIQQKKWEEGSCLDRDSGDRSASNEARDKECMWGLTTAFIKCVHLEKRLEGKGTKESYSVKREHVNI